MKTSSDSLSPKEEEIMWIKGTPSLIQLIIVFLKGWVLPDNKKVAHKLKRMAAYFVLQDEVLYKRRFSSSLLRCIVEKKLIMAFTKFMKEFVTTIQEG